MFNQRTVVPWLLWLACVGTVDGGEIVISPVAKDKVISPVANDKGRYENAAALRDKAQAYKSGNVQSVPSSAIPVIIQMDAAPEIEEGVLLPRSNESQDASRTRSHDLIHGNIPSAQDIQQSGNDAAPTDIQDNRIQLEKNRFKANQYLKGKPAPSLVSSQNNGSQFVACENTGNVSGRIGDDSISGREIVVIRDGKQVKMRCK